MPRGPRATPDVPSTNDDEVDDDEVLLSKEVVELERLLCDEADDPENATCAIRELQRALKDRRRRTRAWMAVEDDALRAILTVLIDIVRNVIAMAV